MGPRRMLLLGLWAHASSSSTAPPPAPLGWPTVGVWNGSLPELPQSSAGNLPHSPMLGNGYLGAMLATNRVGAPVIPNGTRGPAALGPALHVHLGSNAFWGVYPATKPALGPTSVATRRALGGFSLSGLGALLGSPSSGSGAGTLSESAEQRIMDGVLRTRSSSSKGTLATTVYVHPRANTLVMDVSWEPAATTTTATAVAELTLSAWTLSTYNTCCPPGQHTPAVVPTTAVVLDGGGVLAVTRDALPGNVTSPRRIKAALALAVVGSGASSVSLGAGTAEMSENSSSPVTAATAPLQVDPAVAFRFSVVVSMVDNLHTPKATAADLAAAAAKAAQSTAPSAVASEATAWWRAFWRQAWVQLPTEPAVETLWRGAQYILASSASPAVDAATPAPGLGGPFVTSDNSGWNGDYTLDYNYEATYYGAYASGHPELAELYWQPIIDGMDAALRGAVDRASANKLSGCAKTALHYNAHIGPWGAGDMDEDWETQAGQHMMWNGVFGALLFMNDWEYMGGSRVEFFKNKSLPVLEGLLDWWKCYLVKVPCSPAGAANCPGEGGYRYDDAKDAVNEGTKTVNSQLALAFVARLADVLKRLPDGTTASTPIAADIAAHLAPFDTAECVSPTTAGKNETVWVTSENETIARSSQFAMYPFFPTEFLSTATATKQQLATAQTSARVYCDLSGGRPVESFPATVAAGGGLSDIAWTPEDVVAGMKAHMKVHFGPNLLCDTNGGGIENVGMSRAVTEMLLSAPSGKYITLFPFWPKKEPASFGGLMAKGGFRLWANYSGATAAGATAGATAAGVVASPVRLESIAGAMAVLVNPWPGHNVTIAVALASNTAGAEDSKGSMVPVVAWTTTPAGRAFSFVTSVGSAYTIQKAGATAQATGSASAAADSDDRTTDAAGVDAAVACTMFGANDCSACLGANDTRPTWASPCVFLSGPSEAGARCQPSKWWFPPYNAAALYPKVHACASCSQPAATCPVLTPPVPPESVCPVKKLCAVEMQSACGAVQSDNSACIACMKAHSAVLTSDGCTTDGVMAFCAKSFA